jgi:SAM-dependent methyltransferase
MNLAPIVLFTYNRLDHTQKTIEALQKNQLAKDSDLTIYSDAAKNSVGQSDVQAVRDYLKTLTGFRSVTVVERERNWGLADSIVDGVTKAVSVHSKVIVLEDDIVTSPYFLTYMNEALELYENEERVMHVSGYFFPVDTTDLPDTFFYNQTSCWGWGTWARSWQHYRKDAANLLAEIKASGRLKTFDMDGQFRFSSTLRANAEDRLKTWAVKWYASVFLNNGFSLHPKVSLTRNIGNDGSGENAEQASYFHTEIFAESPIQLQKVSLVESTLARQRAIDVLKQSAPTLNKRLHSVMRKITTLKQQIIDENFFRPRWYSIFINPYFINRFTLFKAITTFAKTTDTEARVLDVGCGLKPYRNFFATTEYTGIDIAGGGHSDEAKVVDAYYDGHTIPFPDASFDTLICTQVLEHADDPEILMRECSRVLISGGTAFFSMPFTYPEHETPYDFRRFTRFEHTRLAEKNGFSDITISQTTGFAGTFAQLLVVWIFESIPFRSTILKTLLSLLVFAPIQGLGLLVDLITEKSGQTMDYVVTVKKS